MIARFFVILFACIAASLAAGFVVAIAALYPAWSNLAVDGYDATFIGYVITFGAIFVSFFAVLPALLVIVLGEALELRSALYYAAAGAVVAALAYLSAGSWDTLSLSVDGFARRELEVMAGAGIAAGFVYWAIAGRNAGRWRRGPEALPPPRP